MNTKTLSIVLLTSLILVGIVFQAACSSIDGASVVMAQQNSVEGIPAAEVDLFVEGTSRSWEIDAGDLAAAREAVETLSRIYGIVGVDVEYDDVMRSWEIDSDDLAAAREAAMALSQVSLASEVDFDAADLVSGELDADDISAARQAARCLAEKERISHEISIADILAARQAALYLSEAIQE